MIEQFKRELRKTVPRLPNSSLGFLEVGDELLIRGQQVTLARVYTNPAVVYVFSDGAEYSYVALSDLAKQRQCSRVEG